MAREHRRTKKFMVHHLLVVPVLEPREAEVAEHTIEKLQKVMKAKMVMMKKCTRSIKRSIS